MGANLPGSWGVPAQTLLRAAQEISKHCDKPVDISALYRTKPIGPANQPDYVNAVCRLSTRLSPAALLALIKQLERDAGRGKGRRWGPRPLDLDILDFRGRVHQWPGKHFTGPRRRLILPHPELHKRAFVLKPLIDVAPAWRHPVLGTSARQLLARLAREAKSVRPMPELPEDDPLIQP